MRQLYASLLIICLCPYLNAQIINVSYSARDEGSYHSSRVMPQWNVPDFSPEYLKTHGIKALFVDAQVEASNNAYSRYYELDGKGNILRSVELNAKDTVSVRTYKYSSKGALNWELVEDRIWNKKYRASYRYNTDKSVYQIKTFELIKDGELIHLATIQYLYDNGKLEEVRHTEGGRLRQSRIFAYDDKSRIAGIDVMNTKGDRTERIDYRYDDRGRILSIRKEQLADAPEVMNYQYDNMGKIRSVSWSKSSDKTAVLQYQYNKQGLITAKILNTDKHENSFARSEQIAYSYFSK